LFFIGFGFAVDLLKNYGNTDLRFRLIKVSDYKAYIFG